MFAKGSVTSYWSICFSFSFVFDLFEERKIKILWGKQLGILNAEQRNFPRTFMIAEKDLGPEKGLDF